VTSVLAATATEFLELEPIGRRLFVFRRRVVSALASTTLEHNIIARHIPTSFHFRFPIADLSDLGSQI
jgi:hypothetical protein